LCDEAKIDCVVVTGMMINVPHAWNKVKLENMYYNVDATNNDGEILYPVFNASDKTVSLDFTQNTEFELDNSITLYASKENKFDYYYLNKLTASTAEELKNLLNSAIDGNSDTFSFKVINSDLTVTDIHNALQEVMDSRGTSVKSIKVGSFASVLYGKIKK
jgi:hypothetical protein